MPNGTYGGVVGGRNFPLPDLEEVLNTLTEWRRPILEVEFGGQFKYSSSGCFNLIIVAVNLIICRINDQIDG